VRANEERAPTNKRQLRMQLPNLAPLAPLSAPPQDISAKPLAEVAFLVLRQHGALAGLGQLVRVLAAARTTPLSPRGMHTTLLKDPRFALYGTDAWGLRAVGLNGVTIRWLVGNGEIGQGVLLDPAVTEPLLYGCPVAPEGLTFIDHDGNVIRGARTVRLVNRHVIGGLRNWMQKAGFAYHGGSYLYITVLDFTEGRFQLSHHPRREADESLARSLSAEFATVVTSLLAGRRGWTSLVELLPRALYWWPGRGAGPCDPFEKILQSRSEVRGRPGGDVRLAKSLPTPAFSGSDYLLSFYDVHTGKTRRPVDGTAPCPCGSGATFSRCCRRSRPR
jgi:hypothetical protein